MFLNTHTYVASKLYKSNESLLLVGSILPDIAVTKVIKWEGGLHGRESTDKFFQFIHQKYPDYLNLSKGVFTHSIVDDFSHHNYQGKTGYAYQNNEELSKLVSKYYGLDEEAARGKAHNYIENGVDILLLRENPTVQGQIRQAIKQTNREQLAQLLGQYFQIDQGKFLTALRQFFNLFTKYDFTKESSWVFLWSDLEELLSLRKTRDQDRQDLLHKSIDIVKNNYKEFLNYSLLEGAKEII